MDLKQQSMKNGRQHTTCNGEQQQQFEQLKIDSVGYTNNIPEKIFAGEIHYARIPVEYWEHRILMIKALGLNALSVYIMWNYHQVQKGKFDYQTQNKNLPLFLSLAKKHGMMVLIRPGPYVCAQWDFGGLPVRFLSDPQIKIRTNTPKFLQQVKIYFNSLIPILKPNLCTNSGPIILLQIQNQYGSYSTDHSYIQSIRTLWEQLNFSSNHYFVDGIKGVKVTYWPNAIIGLNGSVEQKDWQLCKDLGPRYLFAGEMYSGWLTHWEEGQWNGKWVEKFLEDYQFLMKNNYSFNMYMAHGGTNFGLTAGANGYKKELYNYRCDVTSYDYDAPITENGRITKKFTYFKQFIAPYVTWPIPDTPQPIPVTKIPPFLPIQYKKLLTNLPPPTVTKSSQLLYFEHPSLKMFNQGFLLYQTQLSKGNHILTLEIRDFAILYLNSEFIRWLSRSEETVHRIIVKCKEEKNTLRVLVEAMGHVNYDHEMEQDRKGLVAYYDAEEKGQLWDIYKIPIDGDLLKDVIGGQKQDKAPRQSKIQQNIKENNNTQILSYTHSNSPTFFKYTLTLTQPKDTYLSMRGWIKGYLFVNGRNLGRYWNQGPQQALYCPGVWFKKGANQIIVLDLLIDKAETIEGLESLHDADNVEQGKDNMEKGSKCELF